MTVRITKPEFNLREKLTELDKPSGVKGNELLRSNTIQEARDLIGAGRRRLNINGSMFVNQRGNATGAVTYGNYSCDRYFTQMYDNRSGTWSVSQDTDVPQGYGFKYSLKYSCTATTSDANRYLMTIYRMEGYDSQVFDYGTPFAKTVTLSFWIKCSKAGNFQVNFENEQNPDAGYQTKQTIHNADTWEKKIVTIPGDTSKAFTWTSAKAMCFDIVYSAFGSAWASATPTEYWSTLTNTQRGTHCNMDLFDSTSNYVQITGVQLELGKQATEFEHRSLGEELELCKRYFQSNFPFGTPPQNGYYNANTGLAAGFNGAVCFATNQLRSPHIMFHPVMRSQPSQIKLYAASNNDNDDRWAAYNGGWSSGSSNTIDYFGATGFGVRYPAGGISATAGEVYLYRGMWSAIAEI